MNKKKWIALGVLIAMLLGGSIYFVINEFPSDFLTEETIIKELNVDEVMQVDTIQDIVFIDEKHVFVPFISKEENYGYSLWKWQNGKWRLAEKTVTSTVNLIKIDKQNPSSYYFAWNFPSNHISTIKIFMIKDRYFHGMQDAYYYEPRIQMGKSFEQQTTYGIEPLSSEMLKVYEEMINVSSNRFVNFFEPYSRNDVYFTWNAYDQNGEVSWIDVKGYSYNGEASVYSESLFSSLEEDLEFVESY